MNTPTIIPRIARKLGVPEGRAEEVRAEAPHCATDLSFTAGHRCAGTSLRASCTIAAKPGLIAPTEYPGGGLCERASRLTLRTPAKWAR